MDRRRGELDGAHPVEPRGQHLAADQAALQLDLRRGDPERRGEEAHDAERDRDGHAEQLPPALVAVAAQHEDADQERAGTSPARRPGARAASAGPAVARARPGGPGGRAAGGGGRAGPAGAASAHVASPASASVRRVRSSTSRSATGLSMALICSGPAADAVVTVTVGQPEQPVDPALLEVDGLHPRHRRDPPLPAQPAGLRVDGGVGALPAVDPVAHPRHHQTYATARTTSGG